MLHALMLVMALSAAQWDDPVEALDMEIAQLQKERAGANTFSDNERRAEIDRKISFLRRVKDRTINVINARVQRCMRRAGRAGNTAQQRLACASTVSSVVNVVRRAEEIREQLRLESWGWNNRDERAGLQRELEELERSLAE